MSRYEWNQKSGWAAVNNPEGFTWITEVKHGEISDSWESADRSAGMLGDGWVVRYVDTDGSLLIEKPEEP